LGCIEQAEVLIAGYEARIAALRATVRPHRPRVFFEEWDEPIISGIKWVSELVEIAGGQDIFPELSAEPLAKNRILLPDAIPPRAPDVILASWCGKKVVASRISGRAGWQDVPAVVAGRIYEIKSPLILQPGPAALTDGLDAMVAALWPGDQRAAGA
jgi:iron complex transport system substrate-binding protein